jgi:ADP-heptose:LPS heptosyltransferase/GT2 family glycosyltransferase
VRVGGPIRGLGWVSGEHLPPVVTFSLSAIVAGKATATAAAIGEAPLNLSAADVALLGGEAAPGPGSGFVFSLVAPELPAGAVTLRLVARTPAGDHVHDTGLLLMPAHDTLAQPDRDPIKFYIDAPVCKDGLAVEPVGGFLSLVGWAIARDGVDHIEVFVDGVSQGNAHHGVRREDLAAAFPCVEAARAGFAMMLPPHVMKPGIRVVRIDICDKAGRVKTIGFSVRAEAPAAGPGPWQLRSKLPQAEIDLLADIVNAGAPSRWTVLLAPGNAKPATVAALATTLDSLRWQAWERWSVTLLAETSHDVARISEALARTHDDLSPRLRILAAPRPGSRPRRLADLTDGFLIPLTPGDLLGEDALLELALEVARYASLDFLYSDERRTDPADGVEKAFFKPDFSPDLLLGTNYIGRLWAASSALLARIDLTESDLRDHGQYDAVLRLTERANQVGHVAKVLCSRAPGRAEPPGRERAALARAMLRRQIQGTLLPGPISGTWRLRRTIPPAVQAHGVVSIIIPTIAAAGHIRTAIESIRAHTAWPRYEIICIDNIPANGNATQRRWKRWIAANADRVVEIAEPFNWSRFNNRGAAAASGHFLLFLNDDIEVQNPTWLAGLVEHAQRPEIGVVGPQLLYPDLRVQHAGVFLARTAARHAFRFFARDEPGPFGLALIQREVISVTGAAMLMRRDVFDRLGGFNEAHAVVNNDLDFNLRARAAGFSVVYTPCVSLIHHEAASRAEMSDIFDLTAFSAAWGELFLKGDPFFSRHLSPDADDYVPDGEPTAGFCAGAPLIARHKIRRILAVKVDHIGDFVTAFPAFRRIRQHFPEAELTVLAPRASMQLAALEPAIDRLIEFNFFHARSESGRRAGTQRALAALRTQLAPLRFDLAIDLRRQSDTRPILQATGARWLAGFETEYKHPWLDIALAFEGDLALCLKRGHISSALVGLIDHVSAQCETDRQIVRQPPARHVARQVLARLLGERKIEGVPARPLVCVHPGAGATNKQWPAESFAGLIDLLAGEAGASILLIGGSEERACARRVIKSVRCQGSLIDLVGRTRLRDLPSVLSAADLYIGNDSGPKHLAAALGVPTIGIHSGSVDAGEWGAVGRHAITIRRTMSCSPCYLTRAADCHRGLACLDGIRVGDVFDVCRRLLLLATPLAAAASAGFGQAAE